MALRLGRLVAQWSPLVAGNKHWLQWRTAAGKDCKFWTGNLSLLYVIEAFGLPSVSFEHRFFWFS